MVKTTDMSAETSSKLLRRLSSETLFCFAIWAIILLVPVFEEEYDYLMDFSDHFEWRRLAFSYLRYLPYLLLFLLIKLIYEPRFFFKGRHATFFLISFLTAFLLIFASGYLLPRRMHRSRSFVEQRLVHQGAIQPADSLRYGEMHPASPDSRRLDDGRMHPRSDRLPEGQPEGRWFDPRYGLRLFLHEPFYLRMLMAMLMMGSSLAIAVFFRTQEERLQYREQQTMHLQSELDYLKYQINPHFFMNTLNNIHALVDIDGELAKKAIIELSRLMRYLLYESEQTTVPLRRELTFISHYLELMKIRCDESVALTYQKPEAASPILEAGIPPLLLLTFIENAFKHGISHKEPSFIDIRITQENNQLHFYCANSNFSRDRMQTLQGGVGLDNVRKRLQLIYQDRYKLDIIPTRKVFTVDLWLPY